SDRRVESGLATLRFSSTTYFCASGSWLELLNTDSPVRVSAEIASIPPAMKTTTATAAITAARMGLLRACLDHLSTSGSERSSPEVFGSACSTAIFCPKAETDFEALPAGLAQSARD